MNENENVSVNENVIASAGKRWWMGSAVAVLLAICGTLILVKGGSSGCEHQFLDSNCNLVVMDGTNAMRAPVQGCARCGVVRLRR